MQCIGPQTKFNLKYGHSELLERKRKRGKERESRQKQMPLYSKRFKEKSDLETDKTG